MTAPFWRINDHVYNFFHVTVYLKAKSYTTTLTIHEVSQSFNNCTFQCTLIDHMTEPITEVHGILNELTVNGNTFNENTYYTVNENT